MTLQPVGIQLVPRRGLDRPQILADYKGLGAMALQGEDRQELVGRVAHIGARARLGLRGNPEEAKQPHHVVNPQAGRMAGGRPEWFGATAGRRPRGACGAQRQAVPSSDPGC